VRPPIATTGAADRATVKTVNGALSPAARVLPLVRLAVIGAVLLVAAGAFAYTGGWLSPGRLTPGRVRRSVS